jgi:competence protein ComEC
MSGVSFQSRGNGRVLSCAIASARKAPLLIGAVAGGIGIVLADRGLLPLALPVAAAMGGLFFPLRTRWRGLAVLLAGSGVALGLLAVRHHTRLARIHSFPLASSLSAGNEIQIEGRGWIATLPEAGDRSVLTTVHLEHLRLGGIDLPCDHRVPCWIQKQAAELDYGTGIRFSGRILPLEGPVVPGGFDARAYYFRQSGSLGRLEIRDGDDLEILPERNGFRLVGAAFELRRRLEGALLMGVPPSQEPYARLVAAMALGAREQSPEELEESFRISGTMHLFAVSGLNVAIVAGMLTWIAAVAGIPKSRAVAVIIPVVLFYAVLTGFSPSAVRAALMASVFLAGYAIREKPRLLNSLGFAALVLLAWDSQPLFLPGFQLSFAVLLFIAVMAPWLATRIAGPFLADPFIPQSLIRPARRFVDRMSRSAAALIAVSLASWLGSVGLLAWHFESVSLIGLVANLVMVPVASLIMGLAAASLAAYGVHLTWITLLANRLNVAAAFGLASLAQGFASIPGATIHTGRDPRPRPDRETLRLDVVGERGDGAVLLEIPSQGPRPIRWMIDSGGDRTYSSRVLPLMRKRGVNRIDTLVLTHGDEGHLGAAPLVLNQFRPLLLLESSVENRSPSHPEIVETAARLGIRRMEVDKGYRLHLGNTLVQVLHPSSLRPGRLADDRALVLKISHGGQQVLLTSDSGFETERFLLETGVDLRSDLWLRGQHRDGPAGLQAFVEAVRPRIVISTHSEFPASERIPETLRRFLSERGIPLFELEASGTVSAELSAEGIRVVPFSDPGKALVIPGERAIGKP